MKVVIVSFDVLVEEYNIQSQHYTKSKMAAAQS